MSFYKFNLLHDGVQRPRPTGYHARESMRTAVSSGNSLSVWPSQTVASSVCSVLANLGGQWYSSGQGARGIK